jgi:hypothetical protein
MRQSSSNDHHHVWLFCANFYSRHFLFAPFCIPNLLNSHLTKVKESRTPIYEKHHLARRVKESRTPIYEKHHLAWRVKESRTPIYEKHHLARRRISWADLSRIPINEIWSDSNLWAKIKLWSHLATPIYEICPISIPIFNSNFQFQFSIPIFNSNFQFQFSIPISIFQFFDLHFFNPFIIHLHLEDDLLMVPHYLY